MEVDELKEIETILNRSTLMYFYFYYFKMGDSKVYL